MDEDYRERDCFIQDGSGHRYRLHISEFSSTWCLKVFDGAVCAAYAYCRLADSILTLSDLRVANETLPPERGFSRLKRMLLNQERKPVSYRTRGLGSALLQFIVDAAKARGLAEVTG